MNVVVVVYNAEVTLLLLVLNEGKFTFSIKLCKLVRLFHSSDGVVQKQDRINCTLFMQHTTITITGFNTSIRFKGSDYLCSNLRTFWKDIDLVQET
jgi:hypothetical protein